MNVERTEQLAVLLNLIGKDAAGTALEGLDQDAAKNLNRVLEEFKSDPPTEWEVNSVLEDFERFFLFALDQIQDDITAEEERQTERDEEEEEAEKDYASDLPATKAFPKPEFTGDIKLDLNLLHPYQVAYAVRNDNPVAIAVVINSLADSHAAKTMEFLPAEVRLDVFLQMTEPAKVSDKVEQQILEAALKSASTVEHRVSEDNHVDQLVSLTRSLPKKIRVSLIDKLSEQNPDLAKQVKSEMYQFEDLLLLQDREVQKILAQSDSDALVLALVDANEDLKNKVFSNVSKRARQTIEDEMEFKTNFKAEQAAEAKQKIIDVIIRLDEEGEIDFD